MKLSIISPVYQIESTVDELVKRVREEIDGLVTEFEIILIEDGSTDKSWIKIQENCAKDPRVKGIKLSRNFGQHFAITAGLKSASGDFVVVMDCDLQDNPKYIPILLSKAQEGFDIVYTRKLQRKHSLFKNITSQLFFDVFNFLIENKEFAGTNKVGTFSILSKKVVLSFLEFKDYRRHYLMALRWLGFGYTVIEVQHEKRFSGKSTYSTMKLIHHAIDGITSHSDKLLRYTATFGFLLSCLSFITALTIVVSYFIEPFQAGWASVMVLILFVSGLIILSVGISGIYIGKIFEQTKNRPLYIIDKKENL